MTTDSLPRRVCLLRLSALGDCANVVPVVHTLQAARPDIEITWVINRLEAGLVADLPGVECIVYDKKAGWAGFRALRRALRGRRFDVLLDMHASWRANAIAACIRADRRIGFDRRRARDAQRLVVGERIPRIESRHVVDGFLAFAAAVGADRPVYDWRVPIADADRAYVARLLDWSADPRPILVISPCSSHVRRNWQPERYAAVADHAMTEHGLRVVLVGGPSVTERTMGEAIVAATKQPVTNLIGQTSLKQLLAVFDTAHMLLTPDSGPAHMANAAEIRTITLHAATDPRRSTSYKSMEWSVNRFPEAARQYRRATPDTLKWGTRIEDDDQVMALIPVITVLATVDAIMRVWPPRPIR